MVLNVDDNAISAVGPVGRTIIDQTTSDVCRMQVAPRGPQGLGFELRILWVPAASRDIVDMLIIDEREVCSIQSYGHGQFGDLEGLR